MPLRCRRDRNVSKETKKEQLNRQHSKHSEKRKKVKMTMRMNLIAKRKRKHQLTRKSQEEIKTDLTKPTPKRWFTNPRAKPQMRTKLNPNTE